MRRWEGVQGVSLAYTQCKLGLAQASLCVTLQICQINTWSKVWKTYHAPSRLCIFAIGILEVSIWRQLRFCLSVHSNKVITTKQTSEITFKFPEITWQCTCIRTNKQDMFNLISVVLCLRRELKLCVQILRCYHFFNIFWICWRRCFYFPGPQARWYLHLQIKTKQSTEHFI